MSEVIRAMNEPINCQKMRAARPVSDRSDSQIDGRNISHPLEAVRHMQYVFPIASQIMTEVVSNYGFPATGEGLIQFTLLVRQMERFDEDIKQLNTQVKRILLPTFASTSASKSSVV